MNDVQPSADEPAADASAAARRHRMAVLARASLPDLERALAAAGPLPPWERLRGPETGMVMVRGRMGGTGRAFNLGEMTVTRCAVRLADGRVGHAYLAGRDSRRAELAAVLDAAALDRRVAEALAAAIEGMARSQHAARLDRSRRAAATQVSFFGMVRMG
jgi:alpha-D-ribose 1-methylphosphonate 5-triphosphate synthase subunit PhnG